MIKQVDIWECSECGFEMNSVHASNVEDNPEDCPSCNESRLEVENKRLRAALDFYANKVNHGGVHSPVFLDMGQRAREVLEKSI